MADTNGTSPKEGTTCVSPRIRTPSSSKKLPPKVEEDLMNKFNDSKKILCCFHFSLFWLFPPFLSSILFSPATLLFIHKGIIAPNKLILYQFYHNCYIYIVHSGVLTFDNILTIQSLPESSEGPTQSQSTLFLYKVNKLSLETIFSCCHYSLTK